MLLDDFIISFYFALDHFNTSLRMLGPLFLYIQCVKHATCLLYIYSIDFQFTKSRTLSAGVFFGNL